MIKLLFKALIIAFVGVQLSFAQNVASVSQVGDTVRLDLGTDGVDIIPVSDMICEIDYNAAKVKTQPTMIVDSALKITGTFTTKELAGDPIVLKTAKYTLKITKTPFTIEFLNAANTSLFKTSSASYNALKCDATVISGNYYGVFSDPTNCTSLTFTGKNEIKSGIQGYAGSPFLFTTKGLGIVYDTEFGSLELSGAALKQLRTSGLGSASRKSNTIFLTVGSPAEIMTNYATITGFLAMPPLWTCGFANSQWQLDEKEMRDIINTYRQKQIPIDAYILDFDWMAWGQDNYGEFRWNTTKFPNAESGKLKKDMDSIGIHLMGIRKPRIFANSAQGNYAKQNNLTVGAADYVDYTGVRCIELDFYKPATQQWFWQSFIEPSRNPYNTGIRYYWNDEADIYNSGQTRTFNFLYMQKCQYDGQRAMNNLRVFSLNRNFFGGSQRYGYGHWTGDIGTGFQEMAKQPMNIIKSGLVGSGWTSMDIGGFSDQPDAENYYRWMQIGCFSPIYRVHATAGLKRQPWVFGADAERICRKAINLRYSMIPYTYSMLWKLHKKGIPLTRPCMLDFPDDAKTASDIRAFMFGDYILAAPIYAKGSKSATFYMPACGWYDFWKEQYHAGGADATITTDGDVIPIMIRKGAVIPTRPVTQHTGDPVALSEITFNVYAGDSTTFNYYEDDFSTYDYEKNTYAEVPYVHTSGPDAVERLSVRAQQGAYSIPARKGYFVFRGLSKIPKFVLRRDTILACVDPANLAANTWTNDSGRVKIMVDDPFAPGDIQLTDIVAIRNPGAMHFRKNDCTLRMLSNGLVRMSFYVRSRDAVTVDIFKLTGGKVATVHCGTVNPGLQNVDFNLKQCGSQAYWCVITSSGQQFIKKLLFVR